MNQLTVHFGIKGRTEKFFGGVLFPFNLAQRLGSRDVIYVTGIHLKPDDDADRVLRDIMVNARQEGLQFRFWMASGNENRDQIAMVISAKDEQALKQFDDFLMRYKEEHGYKTATDADKLFPHKLGIQLKHEASQPA